jgi:uncharacterized phiE125 gp8 family phage protein
MKKRTLSEDIYPPVSTTELRDWCRIDQNQDEEILNLLCLAATAHVEQETGRSIAARLYEFEFTPCEGPKFRVEAAPIIEILSVSLRDELGTTTPLDPAEYNVGQGDTAWTFYIPNLTVPEGTTIVAEVETGYDGSTSVPVPLRHAIAVYVGGHYAQREGDTAKAMATVAALIAPYRLNVL